MGNKEGNKNKRRKKIPKKTLRIMMRKIKITKVSKNKKLRSKNPSKKSKFSIHFGRTLIINQESHYQSMNGLSNCKIKYWLLRKKMLKFLLFVLV